ncbi:hypothetical protein J2S31_002177 [Nitrospina gracilis Nb-211]|nr:hypothetical protein [Nitrospina gracilis Nb-211]
MDINKLKFSKKEIARIRPMTEQAFFLLMLNLITEINVFQKLVLYSGKFPRNRVQRIAKLQINLNLIFVLASKLYEGWKLIDEVRHGDKKPKRGQPKKRFSENWFPERYKDQLSPEGKESLEFLENYFDHKNDLRTIRDQFTFHYDLKKARKLLNKTDFEPVELYLPKHAGEVFSSANFVILKGYSSELSSGEVNGLRSLLRDILGVSKHFSKLISDYIRIVHQNFFPEVELELLSIPDPKSMDKVHLTFFSKP